MSRLISDDDYYIEPEEDRSLAHQFIVTREERPITYTGLVDQYGEDIIRAPVPTQPIGFLADQLDADTELTFRYETVPGGDVEDDEED